MRIGYEAIAWQEASEQYMGRIDHVVGVLSKCGCEGVEPEVCMLGAFAEDPVRLKDLLDSSGVTLAAVCYPEHWRGDGETKEESSRADAIIRCLSEFPHALLQLCPRSGKDRSDLAERQQNAIKCINDVARRAADSGLVCAVHPNCPPGSAFRTSDDYSVLADGLNSDVVGLVGEVGNMIKGGMDPIEKLRQYRQLIRHVHCRDMTTAGAFCEMGRGVVDFLAIARHLKDSGYDGWLIIDDLSDASLVDPDGSAARNIHWVRDQMSLLNR